MTERKESFLEIESTDDGLAWLSKNVAKSISEMLAERPFRNDAAGIEALEKFFSSSLLELFGDWKDHVELRFSDDPSVVELIPKTPFGERMLCPVATPIEFTVTINLEPETKS